MSSAACRGVSLVELLVALLLLELAGVAALLAILTTERIGRGTAAAMRDDAERWRQYRVAEVAASCLDGGEFRLVPLSFSATPVRPVLPLAFACGR